jgi:predicted peroxiredoxin
MKKWLLLAGLAIAGVLLWYFLVTKSKPKEEVVKNQPVSVSRYAAAFNHSIDTFLNTYDALTESLVHWDSMAVAAKANTMQQALTNVKWDALQKDTVIYQTASGYTGIFKNDIEILTSKADLTAKRHAYHALSQNLYDMLRTIKYDGAKLYLQQCPMAFNDTEEGLWLSKTEKIRNPYLGLHHPKYKSGMISCGETKDTIHYPSAE